NARRSSGCLLHLKESAMKRVLLTLVTYGCGAAMVLTLVVPRATAQLPFPPDLPPAPGSLKNIKPPVPANLGQYIADTNAAIVLGKALFWDQQVGTEASNVGLACASCHFHAG